MTGVGGRPELIIKGSDDLINWEEYDFQFKPGNVEAMPLIVMPH